MYSFLIYNSIEKVLLFFLTFESVLAILHWYIQKQIDRYVNGSSVSGVINNVTLNIKLSKILCSM